MKIVSSDKKSVSMPKLRTFGLCVLVALSAALTACDRTPQATSTPEAKASSPDLAARPAEPASQPPNTAATAPELTAQCQAALHVLSTCAFETSCNADMTMYLPSAARDQLVVLTKNPGFKAEAFDRYCERTCNSKSPQVDVASFAREVCGEASSGLPAQVGTGASTDRSANGQIAFHMQGLPALHVEPVKLADLMRQFGQPLKSSPSSHQCDSAFDAEGVKELTFAFAGFETDGNMAVLRWVKMGASVQVSLPGWPADKPVTMDGLKTLQGFASQQMDDRTVRVGVSPGASLETAYDFKFVNGRLDRVEYWIGC